MSYAAERDMNANRCSKRFPGPDKGSRCYFDKMQDAEVCAGHEAGDTFDAKAYNGHVPKPPKKKRQPRRVRR